MKACYCRRNIAFVCGGNNQTFNNPCLARCSAQPVVCRGQCPCTPGRLPQQPQAPVEPVPRLPWPVAGVTPPSRCRCPDISRPVCVGNGKSLRNRCEARCQGASIQCLGPCPCTVQLQYLWDFQKYVENMFLKIQN